MADLEFTFTAPLWLWNGKGAWHFITVPEEISAQIKMFTERRGFGSVRVTAAIEGIWWKTSVFPDNKTGCYLLPVKAEIRRKCGIVVGKGVSVRLDIDVN